MENKKSNEEYAKNYPTVQQDGYFGPITVGNNGEYDGRDLINLCVKTVKSGDRNAVASFPKGWGKARLFTPGDQVNVVIEDGFVKKMLSFKNKGIKLVTTSSVNDLLSKLSCFRETRFPEIQNIVIDSF
jgi:hypothetical protein